MDGQPHGPDLEPYGYRASPYVRHPNRAIIAPLGEFRRRHRTDPATGEPWVAIYPHRPGRHGDARGTDLERSGGTGEAGCQHARDRYVPRRRWRQRQGEHEYGRRLDQLLAKRDQQHRRKRLEVRGYQFRHGDIRR